MVSDWSAVDVLLRELGAVRAAANTSAAAPDVREAIEGAIGAAAEALDVTIDHPTSRERLAEARAAIRAAMSLLDGNRLVLRAGRERMRTLRAQSAELRRSPPEDAEKGS